MKRQSSRTTAAIADALAGRGTLTAIAAAHQIHLVTLRRALRRQGIEERPQGRLKGSRNKITEV